MFETTNHDLGRVARASKAEYRFQFKNLYKEDVHISGIRTSCGCVTATVTQSTLKTHETAEIVADFNTRAFLGQKSSNITVVFDKPYYAEVRLHISGYIRSDVVFDPPQVELGTVDAGSSVERPVMVRYAGRPDWEIVDVTSGNPHFEVEVSSAVRNGNRTDYELLVRLTDDAPVGYVKDQLTLVTNDYGNQRIPLFVEGRVVSAVSVSPASVLLGDMTPGQKVTRMLIVQGSTPFRVTRIDCDGDDGAIEAKLPDDSLALHRIPVTFTAGDSPGSVAREIRIYTNDSDSPVATCEAIGTVME